MEIDLKDQIIILDEAHNMEDSAREAGSGSLTSDQLNQAIHNLQELCKLISSYNPPPPPPTTSLLADRL